MNTAPIRSMAIIGRSSTGLPRTFRLESPSSARHPNAAYRRLAATIVGLDVVSLAMQLRSARLSGLQQISRAA